MPKGPIPQWLMDAVIGLVASAYEAGRADATVAAPAEPKADLTLPEVAEELRIGMTTLTRLIKQGEIPSFRVGARRFVRRTDLDVYRKGSK